VISFTIPKINVLAAVAVAADHEDNGRPVLATVCVERRDGKATATATDPYRLASAPVEYIDWVSDPTDFMVLIPAEFVIAVKRLSRTATITVEADEDGHGTVSATANDVTVTAPLADSTDYPRWRELLPKEPYTRGDQLVWLNPGLLAPATKFFEAVAPENPIAVVSDSFGPNMFTAPNGALWLIMPVRGGAS